MTHAALDKPMCEPGAVVVGGSAGAIDALQALLERLPKDFAAPVAVVIHTPPGRPSGLVQVLAHRCPLPVREPVDKEPLQGGTVFVAAPGYHLLVERGPYFAFSVDAPENYSRPSIDVLFESAADVFGRELAAVLLSGANQDGARGLRAVADAGGKAFVQSLAEAASPEMPEAALAACPGAEGLSVVNIAERLVAWFASGARK
jgi:two-component system chemotaxis response regulator CheB